MSQIFIRTLFIFLITPYISWAALIPTFFPNCVVALGCSVNVAPPKQPLILQWQTEGTGFLYGRLLYDNADPLKRRYDVYLVTAKHVVKNHLAAFAQLGDLKVRLNSADPSAPVKEFPLYAQATATDSGWFFHPKDTIDVAIIAVNLLSAKDQGITTNFFYSDTHTANKQNLRDIEVSAGDGIFVLGFPMNLAGLQKNYVIVRQGCIARISEMLDGASDTFMLDAFVFPGNSGGPVILRPDVAAIKDTKPILKADLIGMITSYRFYTDIATSQQTHQPRVIFQENAGLAEVLPMDFIDETIALYRKANPLPVAPADKTIETTAPSISPAIAPKSS